jgi:uncharacterized protein (TIGR00369 family)
MWNNEAKNRQLKPSGSTDSTGKADPIGMKLHFELEGLTARANFVLNGNHHGHQGYVHDGVIALLIDEAMGWTARHIGGVSSVTATLEIEYQRPACVNEPLTIISQITRNTKRLVDELVQIKAADGSLIATGTCSQFVISPYKKPE